MAILAALLAAGAQAGSGALGAQAAKTAGTAGMISSAIGSAGAALATSSFTEARRMQDLQGLAMMESGQETVAMLADLLMVRDFPSVIEQAQAPEQPPPTPPPSRQPLVVELPGQAKVYDIVTQINMIIEEIVRTVSDTLRSL